MFVLDISMLQFGFWDVIHSGAADEVPLDRHVQLEKDTDLRVPRVPVPGCPFGRTEQKWLSTSREVGIGIPWNSYPNIIST